MFATNSDFLSLFLCNTIRIQLRNKTHIDSKVSKPFFGERAEIIEWVRPWMIERVREQG